MKQKFFIGDLVQVKNGFQFIVKIIVVNLVQPTEYIEYGSPHALFKEEELTLVKRNEEVI
jgi:uncharacterized protein YodC (DUF2158 family)